MELIRIELVNVKGNFNEFQFILHYNNNVVHILNYSCDGIYLFFGNLLKSSTANNYNNEIFNLLNIHDANEFVSNIVGYPTPDGIWPVTKTKQDFIKVLHALEYYMEF